LAHTAVWNILVWPGPQAPLNAVLLTVANAVLVLNLVLLFVGTRRALHDRLAGTVVQVLPRKRSHPAVSTFG
jgi:uncharacterized RDD family membrane protein YckC